MITLDLRTASVYPLVKAARRSARRAGLHFHRVTLNRTERLERGGGAWTGVESAHMVMESVRASTARLFVSVRVFQGQNKAKG